MYIDGLIACMRGRAGVLLWGAVEEDASVGRGL